MKNTRTRIALTLLLAAAFLFAAGCTQSDRPLLGYQDTLVSADVSDGTHTWRISPTDGGFTAVILTPPEAEGVTFLLTDVSSSVSLADVTVPVSDKMTAGARRLAALFTLDEARISEVRPDKDTQTVRARVRTDEGEITVTLGKDGIPVSFETSNGTVTVLSYEAKAE